MATKKKTTKAVKKDLAVVDELSEMNLSSAALAQLSDYDTSSFEGVELDITGNKELFNNDIVIPKIWLMQDMSELAKDKSRKDIESGDFVESQSEEVLLKVDGEKEFIPFIVIKTFKRWQTFRTTQNGKPLERHEFVKSELITLENHALEYEFTEGEESYRRRQVISAYVLKGEDAQAGIIKPLILDFASTSKGGGRQMVSDIKVLNAKNLPSYVGWFKLGCKKEAKDKDTYFVKTVKFGGLLPEQMMPFLKDAYIDITSMIESNVIEIDDRDLYDGAKGKKEDVNVSAKVSGEANI